MKLYYMPGACSLAAHIIMRESGQTVELERVGRDKKTEHGENFLEVTPKGYVPALRMDDGEILTENIVVHNYLADLKPASKLAPAHGTKAREGHQSAAWRLDALATTPSPSARSGSQSTSAPGCGPRPQDQPRGIACAGLSCLRLPWPR
mgnify:CR=1 FL=1